MLEKAQLLLDSFRLKEGERILVGFSGGSDSTALLSFLAEARGKETIAAYHVHHGIRGAEADRDEAFCREFCEKEGILFASGHADVPALAREQKLSLETAARDVRYALLKEAAAKLDCPVIALAHHLNDFAETFLYNLARGAGSAGLSSIPADREEDGFRIIRPFLSTPKAEIEKYLSEKGLRFVSDSSNDADDASRNQIRHHVIPALEQINPGFLENLRSASLIIKNDDAYISREAEKIFASRLSEKGLLAEDLFSLPPALSSRVLKRFLSSHGVSVTRTVLASAEALFSPGTSPSASCDVGNGLEIRRCYVYLTVGKKEKQEGFIPLTIPLSHDGEYHLSSGLTVSLKRMPFPGRDAASGNTIFIRPTEGTLLLRPRRPGDRFTASGGTKELKKLFIDKKIPKLLRNEAPVGEIAGEVAFVYLIGAAKPFWVEGEGADAIRIQIRSI
ncbi:MAG: tRNA lysidine(34) synthetase TilS [Clostridia bacterium]|nr:tRNA lysidine(34) synthetase TilS [Clostridia bacterium]